MKFDPKMQKCIDDCSKCSQSCVMTIAHCLKEGGMHSEPQHINLLKDCAEVCKLSEGYMLRQSENHMAACGLCAEICIKCAKDCEEMAHNDVQMMSCAEDCRRCAESCKVMAMQ
jgi:hypothetical protein